MRWPTLSLLEGEKSVDKGLTCLQLGANDEKPVREEK